MSAHAVFKKNSPPYFNKDLCIDVQEKEKNNQKQGPGIPTLPRLDFVIAMQGGHALLDTKAFSRLRLSLNNSHPSYLLYTCCITR